MLERIQFLHWYVLQKSEDFSTDYQRSWDQFNATRNLMIRSAEWGNRSSSITVDKVLWPLPFLRVARLLCNKRSLSWTISWSHSQDSQDQNSLKKYLTITLSENKPGETASNKPGDTARKRPSLDLVDWQHTMGWRPPSPEIGDRWRPSTN